MTSPADVQLTRLEAKHGRPSYSQVAEDLIAAFLIGKTKGVTYVDIGCLWPVQHSNTFLFYENGGHGMCIDANPDAEAAYRDRRPRDTFISSGVGAQKETLLFHRFENPVFNTFDPARAKALIGQDRPGRRLVDTLQIPVRPLGDLLQHGGFMDKTGGVVDLLSVDVEGAEMSVLDGVDFSEFQPRIVILETIIKHNSMTGNELFERMERSGYELAAFTGHDAFFRRLPPKPRAAIPAESPAAVASPPKPAPAAPAPAAAAPASLPPVVQQTPQDDAAPPPLDLRIVPGSPVWDEALKRFRERDPAEDLQSIDLEDCTIVSDFMIGVGPGGELIRSTVRKPPLLAHLPGMENSTSAEWLTVLSTGVVPEIPQARDIVEHPCVLLGSGQAFNYYHWLVEFISKLDVIREDIAAGRQLATPRFRFPHMTETLKYFGVDPASCLQIRRPIRFRDLRTYSNVAFSMQHLSNNVGRFFDRHAGKGGRRLFVSRGDAASRRILNERDVAHALRKRGFETVTPGALTFEQQVDLFKQADIVIGAHGAGLANIAFMPRGGLVGELVPEGIGMSVTCYAVLSEQCRLRHSMIVTPAKPGAVYSDDFTVDVDLIMRELDFRQAG